MLSLRLETGKFQQVLYRRADARPQVARLAEGLTGQGHHALDQGFTIDNRAFNGKGGADVLHQHTDSGGVLTVRDFFTGQDLGELLGAARRVFGRNHPQSDAWLVAQCQFQGGDRFGFIVLDANQRDLGLQQVAQDLRTFNDLIGMFLHQTVIGSDIWLAFCGVEDQGFHPVHAALQLAGGRETCTAQSSDAGLMNTLDQLAGGQLTVVCHRCTLAPAVFAVWLNDHAQFRQPGRVSGDMRCDGADSS